MTAVALGHPFAVVVVPAVSQSLAIIMVLIVMLRIVPLLAMPL